MDGSTEIEICLMVVLVRILPSLHTLFVRRSHRRRGWAVGVECCRGGEGLVASDGCPELSRLFFFFGCGGGGGGDGGGGGGREACGYTTYTVSPEGG